MKLHRRLAFLTLSVLLWAGLVGAPAHAQSSGTPAPGTAAQGTAAPGTAAPGTAAQGTQDSVARIMSAVVGIKAAIDPKARTAESLGTTREGTGVLIGTDGLVVTIGYLILEATKVEVVDVDGKWIAADIVAYDHNTGFGLLRARSPIAGTVMELGASAGLAREDAVMVISRIGARPAMGALVADRREFAGYWEYLLQDAIFTVPPHPQFGGAALIDRSGRLVGIGSLIVGDAVKADTPVPGNMFLPIDALKPIMDELVANGRTQAPKRPWLGIYSEDNGGRVVVARVAKDGPAEAAGIKPGDVIVGVGGRRVADMADFYRKIWSTRMPGDAVPIDLVPFGTTELAIKRIPVSSRDRYDWLRLGKGE